MLFDTYSCEETVRNLPFEKDGVYTHLKLNRHVHLLYKECNIKDSLVELNSRNTLSTSKPLVKKVFSGGLRVDLGTRSTAVDELKKLLCLSVDDDEAVSSFRAYDIKEVYFTQELSGFNYYPKCLITTIRQFKPLHLSDMSSNKFVQLSILVETQADVYISDKDGNNTNFLTRFVNRDTFHPEELIKAFPNLKVEVGICKKPILSY